MSALWRPAYVAIGSNLDEPEQRVREAFERIEQLPQTRLEARSRHYLSKPLGPQDQPHFVNAAAGVLTQFSARELLDSLLAIERTMGRIRGERWGPRVIDLDLIWMVGNPIAEAGLRVPHPAVSERNFVLYPLSDIAPSMKIPGVGRIADLMMRIGAHGLSVLPEIEGTRVRS